VDNPFDLLSLLLGLAALLGIINYRLFRLPSTVGLLLGALALALLAGGIDRALPILGLHRLLHGALQRVDLPQTLLKGFLGFLLFAGAMEVEFADLLQRKWTTLALATIGTLLSTLLIGAGLVGITRAAGLDLPVAWCFTFGALISPTDPVSVLDMLRRAEVPPRLQATIAGEALLNDGIGVVLFVILAGLATGGEAVTPLGAVWLFLLEAGGGGLLGLACGGLAFLALKIVDDRNLELMISLALVSVTYCLAERIGVSGPVAVVVAGILIGNHGLRFATSPPAREHLERFWSLIDEVLNALLFLLIGLEVAAISFDARYLLVGVCAIPLCLAARGISVVAAALPLNLSLPRRFAGMAILTWGGLRGGISVALALSLPGGPERDVLLAACYAVVIFTLTVQGLSVGRLARWLLKPA
jgi:CPA1 family monovalent cation:H+ antiporter